jgi:hypothetical protein
MMQNFDSGRCHVCGSDNITGEPFEGSDDLAWQDVSCDDCGATRTETYELRVVTTVKDDGYEVIIYERGKEE